MTNKQNKQTNYMQNGAIALLAIGAIDGFAALLGGGLRAVTFAGAFGLVLLTLALDFRK